MIEINNCLNIGFQDSGNIVPKPDEDLTFEGLIKKYNGFYFDTTLKDTVYTIDEVKEVKHQSKIRDRIDCIYQVNGDYPKQKNLIGSSSLRVGFSESENTDFNRQEKTGTIKLFGYGYLNAYMEAGETYTFSFLYHGNNQPEVVSGNYPILADCFLIRQGITVTEPISFIKEGDNTWRIFTTFVAYDTKDNIVGFNKMNDTECNSIDFIVSEPQLEKGDKFTGYQETSVQGNWSNDSVVCLVSENFNDPPVLLELKNNTNYAEFTYQSKLMLSGYIDNNSTVFSVDGKTINLEKNKKVTQGMSFDKNFNAMAFFKGELTEKEIDIVKNYYMVS